MRIRALVAFILFNSLPGIAQKLDYYPLQKEGVSDNSYKSNINILEETYKQVKKDKGNFNYADYWNLSVALSKLKDKEENVKSYLYKSKSLDPESFATIFLAMGGTEERWKNYLSKAEYDELKNDCIRIQAAVASKSNHFEIAKTNDNERTGSLRKGLTDIFETITINDQKYRSDKIQFLQKQKALDEKNMQIIDSLYKQYKTYLGKKYVGEEYSSTMWAVVQHSTIQKMEQYLPVINQAVIDNELNVTPLKMLLDRIYTIKYKYQFFGSQAGVQLAPEVEISKIKSRYAVN